MAIENQIVYWYLVVILFTGIIGGLLNVLAPNYFSKKYASGEWKLPKDNNTRFIGLIFLGLSIYAFAWLMSGS